MIQGFIVDFYCASLRLAVEIDGAVHDGADARTYDSERTAALAASRVTVVRIRNDDVSRRALEELIRPHLPPALR